MELGQQIEVFSKAITNGFLTKHAETHAAPLSLDHGRAFVPAEILNEDTEDNREATQHMETMTISGRQEATTTRTRKASRECAKGWRRGEGNG